ncbi:hypothetical protein M8J77_025524 [Diaphorina citri]|nr:hypothetical protein M8J77_025524 [Diaphorina citri]
MDQGGRLEDLNSLKSIEERASGDSRKWKGFNIEPNAAIKSTLEFCNLCQYLDLIIKYTKNKKDVFLSLDKDDLKGIGIVDKNHCDEIEKAINLMGGKRVKKTDVSLSEEEAIQILKNTNENLLNIDLGMYLYMDELISKRPENHFVSEFDKRTAAHDALDFIRTTKHVYKNLVEFLHQKQILSNKEYKVILNNLHKGPPSKLKKKKLKIIALTFTVGSVVAISLLAFLKSR